jgi:hypothetical protein
MSDDIDEVSLNALIASGVDPAVAYEAAKREPDEPSEPGEPPRSGCLGVLVLVAVVFAYTVLH